MRDKIVRFHAWQRERDARVLSGIREAIVKVDVSVYVWGFGDQATLGEGSHICEPTAPDQEVEGCPGGENAVMLNDRSGSGL